MIAHVRGLEAMLSLESRAAVAECLRDDDMDTCVERLAELAARCAAKAGEDAVETLAVRLIHAQYVVIGAEAQAWTLMQQVSGTAAQALGRGHELTLYAASMLAASSERAYAGMDPGDGAVQLRATYQRLARDTERALGRKHPLSAAAREKAKEWTDRAARNFPAEDSKAAHEPEAAQQPEEPNSGKVFSSLEQFVSDYVSQIFRIDPTREVHAWCREWWRHPEAVVRLSAMMESFHARRDLDLSVWLAEADAHLAQLRHPEWGTFARCSPVTGHVAAVAPLPVLPAPFVFAQHPAYAAWADRSDGDAADDPIVLAFESLEEFVVLYVAQVFPVDPDGEQSTWCPQWWLHSEALVRLSLMWRTYEIHLVKPGLISRWLVHHADPHMAALRDPLGGPFSRCSIKLGHEDGMIAMPITPPPAGFTAYTGGAPIPFPPTLPMTGDMAPGC